jgi:hypothetical protein
MRHNPQQGASSLAPQDTAAKLPRTKPNFYNMYRDALMFIDRSMTTVSFSRQCIAIYGCLLYTTD